MKLVLSLVVFASGHAIQVFDGVFAPPTCEALNAAASARGLGHALYTRSVGPRTALEHAFESFLSEVDDDSPHVEYWSRQEWKHIEAHADVDEALAADGGPLRYPRHAHVLYLDVGSRVRGPTCVWEAGRGEDGRPPRFAGAMTVVPAVAGRVLRFDGSLQHAVPRPADVWLAPFVISQSGPPEDFGRSVVLFNCWPEAEAPPHEVQPDEPAAGVDAASIYRAAPRAQWRPADLSHGPPPPSSGGRAATMKLWLLGERERRGSVERTLPLRVDADAVLAALQEGKECTRLDPC